MDDLRFNAGKARQRYLFSVISVELTSHPDISAVRDRLGFYPQLRLERSGTALLYTIDQDRGGDHFYTLEVTGSRISLTIYSARTPVFFIQEAVLRMLGMVQTLSGICEIRLESLYPYLIAALTQQEIYSMLPKQETRASLSSDIVLSRRLIRLMNENSEMRDERKKLDESFNRAIIRWAALEAYRKCTVADIASRFGIEEKRVIDALDGAEREGYRVAHSGRDTFTLVRL